ncbi:hypothetical protein QVD17_21094 [Tagetes erecta]|uniref:Uncharacterized protein n=1 Tax=Tagetes erecta TaxID=13708 RepID=A0AAD8KMX6_TARER|nr:hypothetical protein QVD17_21094 [Tagetes erecta]
MGKGNSKESKSASSQNENDTAVKHYYSAQDVADAFAKQYYSIMQSFREDGHKFYKEQSIRSHPCADGSMKPVTTLRGIDNEIMASNIKEWNPDLSNVHAQDSVIGSVVIGVCGSLTDNADVARNFAQTFVLAPQEGDGFYVHNDFLQYIEIIETSETPPSLEDVAHPLTAQQSKDTEKEDSIRTTHATKKNQTDSSKKENDDTKNKTTESSKGKNPLQSEQKKKSQLPVWKPVPNMQEEAKTSYASILAKEGSGSSPTPEKKTGVSPAVRSSTILISGHLEKIYDVKSIRVKDLPPKLTEEALLEAVKQFGPVKLKNIQIKEYFEDGYRYAFVEFDSTKSARSAVEARFIQLEDRECEIQYKKHPNQGGPNYNWRPREGFRNDNFRRRNDGNWGHNHNEQHENFGQYSGQSQNNNYRRNR